MGSAILFHGPGSEAVVHDAAKKFGRVIPFGDPGSILKKDEARELVSLLTQTPLGTQKWCVVIGPLDEVRAETADVLLKTLEEFDPEGVRPFLWARDLGSVIPTIRSRCLQQFCVGVDERVAMRRPEADKLLSSYIQKDWSAIVSELKESKGDEEFVLLAIVEAIQERLSDVNLQADLFLLWGGIRELFSTREAPLTPARVLSVFLERAT